MAKYNSRNEYTISTINNAKNREDSWLQELDDQLKKQAVQPRRVDQSMFEQINNIMGNKSKYSSVEDAVKEMQRRSGFLDYFSKKATTEEKDQKSSKGDSSKKEKPKIILKHPNIEATINNYCSHTKGEQDLPAILQKIKSIHQKDVTDKSLWDEEDLTKFIHKINEKNKINKIDSTPVDFNEKNQEVDPRNTDAWHILMPAKI